MTAASFNKIGLCLFLVTVLTRLAAPVLATPVTAGVASAAGPRTLHVRQIKLYDRQGFGRPIVARTFLLPADWQVDGGVQWNTFYQKYQPAYYESFSATSADGHASFELLPNYSWNWERDPAWRAMLQQQGIPLAPPLDAAGVVREFIIPNYRPASAIVQVIPRPELANVVRQQLRMAGLDQLEAGGCRVTVDFVEVRMRSVQNGVPYREGAIVQLIRTDFSNSGMQAFAASNMYLFKAPEAAWNDYELIYSTAMRSMRQNPAWLKAIGQFQRNIARINQQGAEQRRQILAKMYEDIRTSSQESWEHRQESIDHVASEFSECIREVETYHDPQTGFDVELPNAYDYAFSNGLGDYVITNDPTYNPAHFPGAGNWQPLQQAR